MGGDIMVETQQHQEPIRRAQEAAQQAVTFADSAVRHLHDAIDEANPHKILSAQASLGHAFNQVKDAMEQLQSFNNESYGQQIKQDLQQLDQSMQELDSDDNTYEFPKQVR
jgi:GTP-sensing pleiotropic transcriptional regulator CodY